jgi:octaprenyl-diphosphate synthase
VTPAEEESMAAYGMHLGTAFQLTDDMLDYSGDYHDTGKNLGDDLAEGKPTLPLIYAMKTGSEEQATIVRNAIKQGGEGGLQAVLDVIQKTDALDYTRQKAEAESSMASAAISSFPNSNYKECLLQLATFAVARNY